MGKVLVEVEPTLWQRVRAKALERGLKVPEAVGQALRGWLSFDGGSVGPVTASEQPLAAERREHGSTWPEPIPLLPETPAAKKARLQALVDGVLAKDAGALLPHQELARATVTDPAFVSARDQERQRRAAQDRLRTAPEDESQDPGVDF